MDNNPKPGLEPRQLQGDVNINVDSDRLPADPSPSEQPSATNATPTQAVDNTTTSAQDAGTSVAPIQQEQPAEPNYSERANERIQSLIREREEARAQATQYQTMLQNMVGAQVATPKPSEEEVLAKQYKSYNSELGYPTDPREFARYNQQQAALVAQKAATQAAAQIREQQEIGDLMKSYPDINADPSLYGAMIAERNAASQKGIALSYKDAADIATKKLAKRFQQYRDAQDAADTQQKNEAYVESTRGASTGRQVPAVDPSTMSLEDKERWLKDNGLW